MTYLASVVSGPPNCGIRVVIAAQEKMGKTTFATGAPDSLLVPFEQGFGGVTTPHLPSIIEDWPALIAFLNECAGAIKAGRFPFRTLVFDTATQLEKIIHEHTIASDPASRNPKSKTVATMETAHGGYGKAYGFADAYFREFLGWCDWFSQCGINTVLTCQTFASRISDPLHGEFDSWDLQLHSPKNNKTFGKREILAQWADVILFLYEPLTTSAQGGVTRGISTGTGRALGLERTPAYIAGNRYGMRGVITIPAPPENAWNVFAHALYAARGIDVFNRAAVK
jgi:hypothetical protein